MADADLALVRALQAGEMLFRFLRGYVQNKADVTELTRETVAAPRRNELPRRAIRRGVVWRDRGEVRAAGPQRQHARASALAEIRARAGAGLAPIVASRARFP